MAALLMKRNLYALASGLVIALTVSSTAVNAETPAKVDSFAACISKQRNLDVLMLVDESKSLRELKKNGVKGPGNDPNDDRVAALQSVISVLNSSLSASRNSQRGSAENGLKVNVSVAGFGDKYRERLNFTELNDESLDEINSALSKQKDHDNDLHTRYHVALQGAKASFEEHGNEGSCRLLMWFSDGQHDDDNLSGFNDKEKKQIETTVCGEGGLVDQLRTDGVFIVAAGLNADAKQLGLMKMVAEGGNAYTSNGFSKKKNANIVNVAACGETEPSGTFETASNAEKIVEAIFRALRSVPGVPNNQIQTSGQNLPTEICQPEGNKVCEGFRFYADSTIQSFNILVSRPNENVRIEVVMPDKSRRVILDENGKPSSLKSDLISITTVTNNKALVSAHRSKTNSLQGDWYVSFKGQDVLGSTGYISFVGESEVEITSPVSKKDSLEINRNKTVPVAFRVETKEEESALQTLLVTFANGESEEEVKAVRQDDGLFRIDADVVARILKSPAFSQTSSVSLRVEPIGTIDGLTVIRNDEDEFSEEAVSIKYSPREFEMAVRNGEGFPVCYSYDGPQLRFKGTPKISLSLKCQGPDSGNGTVAFNGISGENNRGSFELIEPETCEVSRQEIRDCVLSLKPNVSTYERTELVLDVIYGDATGKNEKASVSIPVVTEKPTDTGDGILAAIELFVLFLVIQGVVRLGFSYLLSRFAPLSYTAERVRFDATLDASGILNLNPKRVPLNAADRGFAIENSASVSQFSVFGYDFKCSPLRTFMRSTNRPLGNVAKSGFVVVGPQGFRKTKSSVLPVTGLVELTLSENWIVGISESNFIQLVDGFSTVEAEVVAFMLPFAQSDLATQEAQLSMEIASSAATQIQELIDSLKKAAAADGANSDGEEDFGGGVSVGGNPGPSPQGPDRFGGFEFGQEPQFDGESSAGPSRRERKKRGSKVDESNIDHTPPSNGLSPDDRF